MISSDHSQFDFADAEVLINNKRVRIAYTVQEYSVHKLKDGRYILTDHDYPYMSQDNPTDIRKDILEEISEERVEKIKNLPEFSHTQEWLDNMRKSNPNYSGGLINIVKF